MAIVVFVVDLLLIFSHAFFNAVNAPDAVSVVMAIVMICFMFFANIITGIALFAVFKKNKVIKKYKNGDE
jgi:ABC-type spermidine/putrescine transport system permease subunit I